MTLPGLFIRIHSPGPFHRAFLAARHLLRSRVAGNVFAADIEEANVLSTILVVLLVLWLLGMVSSYTMGGLVHVLLVVAIAIVLIRVIQGRPAF